MHIDPGLSVHVFENGARIDPSATDTTWFDVIEETDVFTIERDGSMVFYVRNGKRFYQSMQPASGSYVVDSSLFYASTSIGDVLISAGDSGVTRHVYDAVGRRVLRVDADQSKTVYMGVTELRWVGAGGLVTNAGDVDDLLGFSVCGGGSGTVGAGIEGSFCLGLTGLYGAEFTGTWSFYGGASFGAGAEGHVSLAYTHELFDVPSVQCNPIAYATPLWAMSILTC